MKMVGIGMMCATMVWGGQCPAPETIGAAMTPVELYGGISTCLREKRYDEAAQLYAVSQAFGYYDTLRVTDRSAHQAVAVLRMAIGGQLADRGQQEAFQGAIGRLAADRNGTCGRLKAIGHPTYYPAYMINHGLAAFRGETATSLDPSFVPEQGWKTTMTQYMKCPMP